MKRCFDDQMKSKDKSTTNHVNLTFLTLAITMTMLQNIFAVSSCKMCYHFQSCVNNNKSNRASCIEVLKAVTSMMRYELHASKVQQNDGQTTYIMQKFWKRPTRNLHPHNVLENCTCFQILFWSQFHRSLTCFLYSCVYEQLHV
jgi:hypothetical protein